MNGPHPLYPRSIRLLRSAAALFAVVCAVPCLQAQDPEEIENALNLFNAAQYEEAAKAYEAIIQKYPTSPIAGEGNFRLAYIYFRQGDFDKAAESLTKLEQPPVPVPAVMQLADILWPQILASKAAAMPVGTPEREKTLREAIQRYNGYMQKHPNTPEVESALFGRAIAEVQLDELDAAESSLRALVQAFPRSESLLDTQFLLGIIFATQGGKLLDKDPKSADGMAKLGQAETVLRDVVNKNTDVALANDARFQLGEILFTKSSFAPKEEKRALFDQALADYRSVRPKEEMIKAQEERLATILARMRASGGNAQMLKSLQLLQEKEAGKLTALQAKPDQTVEAAIKQAQIYLQLQSLDEARVLLQYIQPFAVDEVQQKRILYYITLTYASQKVKDKAVENYEAFTKKYPKDKMADNLPVVMGAIFLDPDPAKNDPAQAIKFFDRAIEDYPNGRYTSDAVAQKAVALLQMEDYKTAEKTYRDFLKTKPRKELAAAADFGLATIEKDTGKTAEAIKSYKNVAKTYPDTVQAEQAAFWVGQLESKLGSHEAAIGSLSDFVKKYPKSALVPPSLLALGQSQNAVNQIDKAITTYNRLANDFPDSDPAPYAYLSLAQIYGAAGDVQSMVGTMRKFIEKYPDSQLVFSAYDTIAQSMLAERKLDEASATYRQMVETNPKNPQSALALQKIAELQYAAAESLGRYIALDEEQRAAWEKAVGNSIDAAEQLIADYPDSPAVSLALQTLLADQRFLVAADKKQPEDIETYFRDLAKKSDNNPATRSKILFSLASYLYAIDKEKALALMTDAYNPKLLYAPGDIDLYAEALLEGGKFAEAKKVAEKLAADYPNPPGDPKGASREVQEAQSISLYILSKVSQEEGNGERAAELSDQLKQIYPWSPKILQANFVIAQSYIEAGKFDEAIQLLIPAIQSPTATAKLRANAMLLGGKVQEAKYNALGKEGKTKEAREALESAIDYYLKIAAFYQGVPDAASEGLWLGGQLLEIQAGTRQP